MRLVRSWPATVPEDRPHVVDGIDRFIMEHYDYRGLADVGDDLILIEWDLALDRPQLETFMRRAADNPEQVRVAPYLLYPASTGRGGPIYCHKIRHGENRWVTGPEDPVCQMFGFGLVYLPRVHVLKFMETFNTTNRNRRFSDVTFSYWHWRHAPRPLRDVPIDWDCHAVHMHYELPEVPQPCLSTPPSPDSAVDKPTCSVTPPPSPVRPRVRGRSIPSPENSRPRRRQPSTPEPV